MGLGTMLCRKKRYADLYIAWSHEMRIMDFIIMDPWDPVTYEESKISNPYFCLTLQHYLSRIRDGVVVGAREEIYHVGRKLYKQSGKSGIFMPPLGASIEQAARISQAEVIIQLYLEWEEKARACVRAWICVSRRCGVSKDMRVMIARIVWEEREDVLSQPDDVNFSDRTDERVKEIMQRCPPFPHRRLSPVYVECRKRGLLCELYESPLDSSSEGWYKQFGVPSFKVTFGNGKHVWIGDEGMSGTEHVCLNIYLEEPLQGELLGMDWVSHRYDEDDMTVWKYESKTSECGPLVERLVGLNERWTK